MKHRPKLELLRAKLALMNPDACPAAALAAATDKFPNALQTPWLVGATVTTATANAPQGSSSSRRSSSALDATSAARSTSSTPQSAASRTRSGRGAVGVHPTAATAPPPRDARIVTANASLRVAASASGVVPATTTTAADALNFAASDGTGVGAAFTRGPKVASPVMPPGSMAFTRALPPEGRAASSRAESDDQYVYGGQRGEVIEISDDSGDEDVEMADADDRQEEEEEEEFEPRHVVVDAVGWVFREVATARQAARRCEQKNMPPIRAGNGVWLYVNDEAHAMLLEGLERVSFVQWKMTGLSRNGAMVRSERGRLRRWERERGYVVDAADREWDFSPLWYMLKAGVEAIKSVEKRQIHACADGGGGGFGASQRAENGSPTLDTLLTFISRQCRRPSAPALLDPTQHSLDVSDRRTSAPTPAPRTKSYDMARQKSSQAAANGAIARHDASKQNGTLANGSTSPGAPPPPAQKQAGAAELVVCVAGIYASFLSWALLQERITTTRYGPPAAPETFTYSIFLNTVQSAFAALTGYVYLVSSKPKGGPIPAIFPSRRIFFPLALVAVTSSLASPFGYASLKYIDYVTFILAKSCKLLPVMFLHLTVFRKRYPLYKYAVVALVTMGVAVFTLHHPSTAKKAGKHSAGGSNSWGLLLLGINLLFDGLTNSTQDHIFTAFKPFSGPQMMCAQNIMSTMLTSAYLLLSPYIAQTPVGAFVGMSAADGGELQEALSFVTRHPQVGWDVLSFAACGAVGQVFIFYTLAHFSSLLLVTVTVTRKMLTMVLSVLWFGHSIQGMQWLGVGLVFGGIGAEAAINKREKQQKEKAKREAAAAKGEAKKEL
ncbi:UAA transporter [Neofusicoccum parvum]|nr:UAA transporter [Neofusicoccum parvum]